MTIRAKEKTRGQENKECWCYFMQDAQTTGRVTLGRAWKKLTCDSCRVLRGSISDIGKRSYEDPRVGVCLVFLKNSRDQSGWS